MVQRSGSPNRALKEPRTAAVDLERKKLAEAGFVQGDLDPATYTTLSAKLDAELVTGAATSPPDPPNIALPAPQNVIFPGGLATDGERLWITITGRAFNPWWSGRPCWLTW